MTRIYSAAIPSPSFSIFKRESYETVSHQSYTVLGLLHCIFSVCPARLCESGCRRNISAAQCGWHGRTDGDVPFTGAVVVCLAGGCRLGRAAALGFAKIRVIYTPGAGTNDMTCSTDREPVLTAVCLTGWNRFRIIYRNLVSIF